MTIVNNTVNDVAVTVLPDAPTDPATGLPVPTIAVATNGGVSVIKDDGTVVDITGNTGNSWLNVSFSDTGKLWAYHYSQKDIVTLDVPSADYNYNTGSNDVTYNEYSTVKVFVTGSLISYGYMPQVSAGTHYYLYRNDGAEYGISALAENLSDADKGMVAYTTSTYNTGWMPGDIKGAFLADTDDTDLVATNTISDRSVNALTLTLADAATVQAVATGAELVSYTFAGAESVTLGSDISTTGALIWWEKVSGIWQLNVNDLSGGTDYVNGIAGTVSTGLTISGTTLSFAASKEMALARATATIPTAGQIAKIYEDEKFLFQENAACTLYGASDAVTALAHDSGTGLLHVGTSAGRSVFQGLRRVDNTTTAVGAAISASGALVVEE